MDTGIRRDVLTGILLCGVFSRAVAAGANSDRDHSGHHTVADIHVWPRAVAGSVM